MDRDGLTTGRARVPSSGMLVALTVLGVVLFATGVGPRPDGAGWDRLYDVVLYNCAYLPAAVLCCSAARRLPRERLAWRALAVSLLLNATANVLRTLTAGLDGNGTSPILAVDVMSLIAYLTLYVTMVGLIRARVPRFHPSMWLDGLIGALGTTAVGVAFLIGPYLDPVAGRAAVPLVQLAMPVTDVLLFALMVAVGSILGARLDRTLLLVTAAMGAIFVG
ncbi:MAG TPA: GGDEF-domain containing protein, partial [Blastococcus sp.]